MKIAAIQFDMKWCEIQHNHRFLETYIHQHLMDSDVIVLPEMFPTGFAMKPERIAQTMDGATVDWMRKCAIKYNKAIVGSVAIRDGANYVNRMLFVKDNGEIEYYDKRHLFRMSGEDKVYTQGRERKIIEYKGVRFLLMVCYDLRFPVWSRTVGTQYDVILYVASWPDARINVWDILLKARAIENQSYVVGVNRIGEDRSGAYSGHSVILNYRGEVIEAANDNEEMAITADISIEELKTAREKFPAYLDEDNFTIEL